MFWGGKTKKGHSEKGHFVLGKGHFLLRKKGIFADFGNFGGANAPSAPPVPPPLLTFIFASAVEFTVHL